MADNARLFLMLSGSSGAIRGETRVSGLRHWIEIDDWDWKLDASGDSDDRMTARPSVLSISKAMDRSSTGLLAAMHKGDLLTGTIRMQDASMGLFDLAIELEKVRVLSYEMRTQASDKRLSVEERWCLDYEALLFKYRPDLRSGVMQVRLERPPGSSTEPPTDKARMFRELTGDMSVQDLAPLWERIREIRNSHPGGMAATAASTGRDKGHGPGQLP